MKTKTFRDMTGKEWNIDVTAGNLLRACRSTGLTLADLTSLEIKLEDMLQAIPHFCTKQLKERKMSNEELLDTLDIQEMKTIFESFFPAVAESFPTEEDTAVDGISTTGGSEEVPLSPTLVNIS